MTGDASISSDKTNSDRNCTYWVRDDAPEFITDPDGEIVNLARLTAYAEHGEQIHEAHAHHELPLLKIDAPRFLDALTPGDHGQLHGQNPEPVEVDGIPLVRADR